MKELNIMQMEEIEGGNAIMCGFAIASFGVAVAALSTASGGTTSVLLAGIGYSLATGSLTGCLFKGLVI